MASSIRHDPSVPANHARPPRGPSNPFSIFARHSATVLRTLSFSVSRKPFVCHSYENCRVCTNNSQSGTPRARAGERGPAEILPSSTSVPVNSVFSVDSVLIPACPRSPRFTDHCPLSPIPFLFILLRTLLHSAKSQLLCFHGIPDSLHKTPGVGYTYLWLLSLIGRSLRTGRGVSLPTLPFQLSTVDCQPPPCRSSHVSRICYSGRPRMRVIPPSRLQNATRKRKPTP